MKGGAFDDVVGGVRERDRICTHPLTDPFQERIPQLARGGLQRALRHRLVTALADQGHAQARAQVGNTQRHAVRAVAESVVVVRGHELVSRLVQGDQERGRVGAPGYSDEDSHRYSYTI